MTNKTKDFLSIEKIFLNLQKEIIKSFSSLDNKSTLNKTKWDHKAGGGGVSCEISNGEIIEKGMINFSSIKGQVLPNTALGKKTKNSVKKYLATGVSVVIHPINPFVPCSHLNVRYFETDNEDKWWFGGGYDLTPYFIYKNDVELWHNNSKKMCDKYDKNYYKDFAKQCDEYFYLKHRNEKRGIGGIFYDDLHKNDKQFYKDFSLDVGSTYLDSYLKIIRKRQRHKDTWLYYTQER